MKFHLILVFSFLTGWLQAQSLRVYWSDAEILIGQQTRLILEVEQATNNFQFDPVMGTIPCSMRNTGENLWQQQGELEVLAFRDTVIKKLGKSTWKGIYTLTAWDSAQYQFPLVRFRLNGKELTAQPAPLTVKFEKKKIDDDISEVAVDVSDDTPHWFFTWGWIALSLILSVVILFLWNRRQRLAKQARKTLKQRTLEELNRLSVPRDVSPENLAQYYVSFSGIIRKFLGERFELNLLERTTQETCLLLQMKEVDPSSITLVNELLQVADLIKFGKMTATTTLIRKQRADLEQLIHLLSPLELIE